MKRILFALIAVVAFLGLAEAVCRVAFPGITERPAHMQFTSPHLQQPAFVADDTLFWKPTPNHAHMEINAAGFRGPIAPKEKPKDEFRILFLGDSCTFGLGGTGIAYDRTYPAQVQKLLADNKRGATVRALNFGCAGYTSYQGLRLLERDGLAYRPDVIVAYFGINDRARAIGFMDKDQRPVELPPNALVRTLRRSSLYWLLTRGIVQTRRKMASDQQPLFRVTEEDYHQNLDGMAKLAAGIGARIYFIAPPYLFQSVTLQQDDPLVHPPAIDVLPELAAANNQGAQVIFAGQDNVHPTPQGHAAIARSIASRLRSDLGL